MVACVIGAERLVIVIGGVVVRDCAELGLRCSGGKELCTELRAACYEFMCESLGECTDIEFCLAVGDSSWDNGVAADGGNVDQLRIFYLSEVSYEECGKDGQCLDV